MFEDIVNDVSTSASAYPLILGIVLGDAVIPVLPGETAIITGGIFAAGGDLSVWLVLLAGALGAFLGDNITYWLGRKLGGRLANRFFRSEKSQARFEWTRRKLEERGATIIITARFIPGGRTAATFGAGTVELPWRKFASADAAGTFLWSAFATALGYFGGQTFKDSLWKPLLIALGCAALAGVAGEALSRRSQKKAV